MIEEKSYHIIGTATFSERELTSTVEQQLACCYFSTIFIFFGITCIAGKRHFYHSTATNHEILPWKAFPRTKKKSLWH